MSEFGSKFLGSIGPVADYSNNGNNTSSDDQQLSGLSGLASSAFHNIINGAENAVGGAFQWAGQQRLAGERDLINNALSDAGIDSSESLNNYSSPIGNAISGLGNHMSEQSEIDNRPYASYESNGGMERFSNPNYYTDPRGLTADVANGIGSSIPSILATIPLGGLGAGGKVAANASKMEKLGGILKDMGTFGMINGFNEAVSDAGSIVDDLRKQGYTEEQIADATNALIADETPMLAASDAITGGLLGGGFKNMLGKGIAKNAVGHAGLIASDAAGEGVTEMRQQQLQKGYLGQPHGEWFNGVMPDEAYAGAAGFAGGLGMSGMGAAGGAIRNHFQNRGQQDDVPSADNNGSVDPPEDVPQSGGTPAVPQSDAVDAGFDKYDGQRMQNGRNGCVEAVGKIGSEYSPFLAKENESGQVNVSGLVNDAQKDGVPVIPFDESALQKGDVIVFGDEDHVLIADGNGGYFGNSSNADGPDAGGHVLHGTDIYGLGKGLQPTKIIKTGSGDFQPGFSGQQAATANEAQQPASESSKPLFDMNGDSMLAQFAENMKDSSGDPATIEYFKGMFKEDRKGNDVFRATDEQKKDMQRRYAAELDDFAAQNSNKVSAANQQPANNQNQLMPSVMAPYNTMAPYRTIPGVPAQTRVHTQPMDTVQQIAMAEPAKEADARKQQGQAILLLAAGKGTSLEDKLAAGLRAGYARAITTAQERLANNGISVPAAEAVMNGRMNNNENSQSSSTATAAQGSNTENQHENAVPQQSTAATEEVKVVPQAYRGTYVDKTPDYDARYRGGIKNGVIDVWQYDFMKKANAPVMSMSLDEVRKAANRYGNSMAGLRELIKEKRDAAVEKWINDSPNTKLREARRDNWENDTLTGKLSAIENRGIDSALHVAAHLYEKATGEKPMSGWEKQEKKLKASNKAQEKSAQNMDSAQWIASHKFSYDTNKSVDENIHIAEQMSQDYIDRFGTTDKINTPERDALRRNIVDRLYGNGAKKKGNEVYLIVGLPASGKSTIADPLVKEHGAILIDSDEAKKLLPEFSNGLLATAVHEESSIITKNVTRRSIINGDNIVMPIVGKTYSSLKRKIDGFRLSGYKINLVYVDLPVEKAIERVKNRFKEDGRLVSPKYLASVGLKPKENYDKLKSDKEVDSYEAWNNDVRRGQQPILLEQGPSESGMGRLRNERNSMGKPMGRSEPISNGTSKATSSSEQLNHSDNQSGFSMSGKQATVISDNGNEVKVHYKIVPADSLITSNSAKRGLAVNPAYPKELQPRDRQRVAMEQQVTEMSHNLRPEDLADSRNLNEGAPIVRSDKVVLNGNGRSISIIRALKGSPNGKVAKSYYKYLVSNAERFGFDRQAVLDMVIGKKEPILVREVDGNISDKAMQDIIGSTAGGSRMGASEQAKADAKKITADSLSRYVDNVTGDLTSAANRDFVAGILYNITSKNDVNAYLDDKGHVNADGIQRVKRALFSLAYGDDELISKMAESTDDNIRNISNALMAAAPSMASLNIKIRDGRAYNIDLAGTISEATKRLDYLRQNGQPVENYLSNQSMFSEYQDTPEMQEVLRYFDKNKRKSKNVAKFIEQAVDSIDSMGDPNQETLITTEENTLGDVIRQAEGDVEDGGQTGLFMDEGSKSGSNEVLQPSEREREEDVRHSVQERETETDGAVPSGRGQAGVNKEESPKKAAKSRQRTFADRSVADEEMLKAFGIKKNDADKSSHKLVDDSDEAMGKYAEQIRKELNKLSVNPIFNTNLTVPAFKLATAYIQRGVTKFADFCGKMLDTLGDNIKPWLKSIWNAAASYEGDKLDEGKLTMMLQAVGSRYEDGITSYDDMRNDIEKLIGKDNMADVEPYIKAAFNGVEAYYKDDIPAMKIEEDGVNESDVRTGGVAERSGKGADQDSVGGHDENEGSGRGGVEGIRTAGTEVRPQRGVRVRDSSTAAGREAGNRGVQAEKSADRSGSTGGTELSGSVRDSYERDTSLDDGRRGRDIEAPGNRRDNEGNPLKTESGKKAKAGTREASINRDLPMLLPEQRGDVLFMETRLHENGAQGAMLTNGTGTGKTFSGMGIVKRMVDQGKKNILIVTPSDEVNKQWVKAAKEFFHINIHTLKDEADAGKGVTITTYANYGANAAIVSREWDMVIQDESQKLMENEQGKNTHALEKLRALTYHKRGLSYRFKFLHPDEYKRLDDIDARLKNKDNPVPYEEYKRLDKERGELYSKLSKAENDQVAEWKKIPQQDKPKVVMLSATPFSRVTNIDYAEGYLFDYGDKQSDGYNDTDAKEQFFVQHFGYRMRYNKLTKPDANVDNSLMEMEFYDWLKSTGAVTGRSISIDKDYDRGFLLTPNAVGTMMDKGFDALREDDRFKNLYDVLDKSFNSRRRNYLLEFIKAKEAVPIIREYLKRGKKVVVFHQAMKEQEVSNPFLLPDHFSVENNELRDRVHQEYALFQAEHPELYRNNMGMDGLLSPVETMLAAFGDKAGFYNGGSDAKRRVEDSKGNKMDARSRDVAEFNDDNGGKKVLVVQQDAGNAGISLHDTTGKFQRVLINLAIPKRPTYAIQTEGRIYRVGSASDAIIRYLTTGTDLEKGLFASTVASRSSTAENLSMGSAARNLRDSFRNLYMETMDGSWVRRNPGHPEEGTGGKEMDHAVNDAVTDYDRAKTHYYGQQKRTAAMKSMEGNDYFSTPEPIGYKMVQWAKHPEGGSILEPSAGHGAISQWFAPNSDQTIIEPSGKLAPLAQMNTPNAKLIHDSFENHNIINKYDSVVMNPPFGTGGKTAIEHVAKAFEHLRDGGRLVAIIPDGPSCQKHLDKWLYGNPDGKTKAERGEESAVLMRTVELPAAAFERAGTKVMTKIIIIDKQESKSGREAAAAEAGGDIDLRGEKDINSLFDRMENMGSPDRVSTSASLRAAETSSVPNAAASSNGSKELDIDGHTVFVSRDGYVSGDTYPVKKDIKMAGARWDSDRKAWHFTDPVKAKEFVNSYSDEKVDITDADRKASEAIFTLPNDTTAQANNRLDYNEEYLPLKSLAAKHGGKYERRTGFAFSDKAARDSFVKEAEAFLAADNKSSASGRVASMMSKVEFSPDSALDGRQTAIRDFGEKMGVPVVFFDGPADLHGFHSRGITFLNRKSAVSIPWTFWHETFHWLKQNNSKLYADMVQYISGKDGFSQEQLDAYREDIGRPELSDGEAIEEMMADAMPDVKRRVTFMKSLARENMTLAQRLVAWIKDIMDRVCDVFHTPVVGLTNTQIAAFKGAFVRLARDMVDANGNHVFRVNEEKNDIRLPGGRLLESIDYSIDNKHSDNQGAFSIGKQDRSYFDKAKAKLEKKFSLSSGKVEVHETTRDSNSMNPWRRYVMSPSRLAKKVPAFKLFYEYANRAMNKLTALRSDYARKLETTMQLVKSKEDRQALYELLAQGDAEGKEYSQAELADSGVNENVAQAYKQVRQLMTKAYHMLNDARRRVQTKSEHANSKKIADLQKNKFVEIIKDSENEDGSHTVTYREQANWKRTYEGVTQEALDGMKKDDAMQILSADEAGEDENGDKLYNVEAREAIPDINKRGGYIPHFFHEYMVRLREKDDAGNVSYHVVGSGRTVSDAVSVANAYLKNHKTAAADKLIVSPKVFDFSALGMDESQYAAVMGDNDYKRMVDTLAAKNDMTLAEARDMVKGAAKMKNRHRFFGNFLQRKGAEGYEKDMDWVLRHYFNSACRYTAMETEFKPKAISLFERIHGDFNKEYKGVAQYTKEYINDVNGVPSALEDSINTSLNSSFIWRRFIASNFGDRAALSIASTISNKVSILKLGFLNVSSALINFTQAANAAAYIGDPRALYQAIAKGAHRKYNMHDLRILVETGVMNDIGLDSGSGYDINRIFSGDSSGIRIGSHEFNGKAIKALKALNHVTNVLGNKSMFLFKQSEGIIRRGTVLAAYNEGIKRGMSHDAAIEFAKDVNRKSNFDYGVHDAPNMFRRGSVISQLLLQFKKYPIKELEVMRDMLPVFSNSTSTKQKALFWGTYFLMAGVCQVPFGDWWDDFMQMFGIHPKDSLKKGLMEWAGDDPSKKMVAKVMMYGAGSLAGVDISSRTGIADVIPTKVSDALGPTISTLRQLGQADGAMQRIRALSPGLSNILMAYTGKSIGARGRVGSEYSTAYDRILRALGFRSVDEAVDSDIQNIYYNQKDTQKKEKQQAVDDYLENPTTDNAKRLRELHVKPETVREERERKKMDRLNRMKSRMGADDSHSNANLLKFAK